MRGKPFVFVSILLVAALGFGWFVYSRWSTGPAGDREGDRSAKISSYRRTLDDPNRIKSGPNYKPIEPILGTKDADAKKAVDEKQDFVRFVGLPHFQTRHIRRHIGSQGGQVIGFHASPHPSRNLWSRT